VLADSQCVRERDSVLRYVREDIRELVMAMALHPRVKELCIEVWGCELVAQQIWRSIEFWPH
jgi:hypothetical protein